MAQRKNAQHGDRVRHRVTGETGTLYEVHTKAGASNYSVIPDTGLRRTVVWAMAEAEWAPPGIRKCQRCGEKDHRVMSCPFGDCGYGLTEEAREALTAAGLDPRRVPGRADGDDAYEGIVLFMGADHKPVRQPLRRRLCTVGDVVVDGHEPDADGACAHCGEIA